MSEAVIEIDRMPLNFVAAASADRVAQSARRIRDAIARVVPSAIASICGSELHAGTSIVFIDRLDVQCSVAAHWSEDVVAEAFAGQLVRALAAERSLGQPLAFRDRAEYLSAFFAAAVDGHAFSRWWLDEFEGLSALPVSACFRTLIANEGALAWEALCRLSADCQRRIVSALAPADADRMLADVSRYPPGRLAPMRTLMSAIDAAMAIPLPTRSHRLIAALIQVARTDATAVCAKNLAALGAIDRLIDAARRGLLPDPPDDTGTAMMAAWHAAGVDTSDIAIAMELEVAPLVERVRALRSRLPEPAEDLFDFTPFGGALVLAVVLNRTGWWSGWRDALAAGFGEHADALAAWLALAVTARALNPRNSAAIEGDPVLRRVFGVPDALRSPSSRRDVKRALATALSAADPAVSAGARPRQLGSQLMCWSNALLFECGRRIPGCDGASPAYLRAQCLSFPAAVARDGSAARLGRPPLDVLLRLSGLKRGRVTLPGGPTIVLAEGMHS
jgi:hypothetical protein